MFHVITHLVNSLFGTVLTDEEILTGMLIALGLWFLDYAAVGYRKHPGSSLIMLLAGLGLLWLGAQSIKTRHNLIASWVIALLLYLPFFVARRWRGHGTKPPGPVAIEKK